MSTETTETTNDLTTTDETANEATPSTDCCGNPAGCDRHGEATLVRPAVDVWTTENEVWLVADVPGAAAESVDVTIERNVLTFEAATRPHEGEWAHREFPHRLFRRSFKLSDQIDRTGIEANVKDGVLRLRLPKAVEAQPQKVAVVAG